MYIQDLKEMFPQSLMEVYHQFLYGFLLYRLYEIYIQNLKEMFPQFIK